MRKIIALLLISLVAGTMPVTAQKKGTAGKQVHKTVTRPQAKKGAPAAKKKPGGTGAARTEEIKAKAGTIAADKIDTFKLQVIPLVKFFTSSLNFLGDPRNAVNEKQTILTQSYLKWCWDPEVQIEDDLDEARLVPLYKDMPAYLTDVSFFFKNVVFTYTIQDVSVENRQEGGTFFKVTANRNLRGVLLDGDSVNTNKVRYIEVNFDSVRDQLKIVSIYTTKLNEKEDLRNWWNSLSRDWKQALSKDMLLEGTLPMADIDSFNDSVAMVKGTKTFIMGSEFYKFLAQIVHTQSLDLSGSKNITDLEPLSRLSGLKEVIVAGLPVSDLMPLRNLNRLESLDISNTGVENLDPLRYCVMIGQLNIKGTPVSDISVVPTFRSLSVLDISGTRVRSLELVKDLDGLKDLKLSHTKIGDLAPIAGLTNLELLNISSTQVADLGALKNMVNLRIVLADSSAVSSLSPLDDLHMLQRVYCNFTRIGQKEALNFLKKHPETSLVYATPELNAWWKGMTTEWQSVFKFYEKIDARPTPEQLHRLALVDSINIAGRASLNSLAPLGRLILLRTLQCQSSGITSLAPLSELTELRTINASNTKITDLQPLAKLTNLETLNIDNTAVADLSPISGLDKLQSVFADNTQVNAKEADRFALKNPACLLVFQTFDNREWWKNLAQPWKDELLRQAGLKGDPDRNQLQQVAGLTRLIISENFQIADLSPVQHLTRLTEFQFSGTSVAKLEPLSGMTQLRSLRLPNNPVSDLMPIAALTGLKELDFSNTQVEDLLALENLVNLEVLKFNGTQIKNLKYLLKLMNLKTLEFYNSRVNNVDVLDGMRKLESIKMFNTRVSQKRVDKLKMTHPGCEIIFY